MNLKNLKRKIREIPDWPQKGVSFKDITPLLEDAESFRYAIDKMADFFRGGKIDKIVGIDARGFLLASAMAYKLKTGIAIARKKGKLPCRKVRVCHTLEYGEGILEMHIDSIKPGEKVLIVDDVLATGGTISAAVEIVEKLGGKIIGIAFLIELRNLNGREKLKNQSVFSLLSY